MSVFNNEPDGDCLDMATANFGLSCADMYFGHKCFDKINRIYRIGYEIMLILSEEMPENEGWRGTGRRDIFALFVCFWAAKVLLFDLFQGKQVLEH